MVASATTAFVCGQGLSLNNLSRRPRTPNCNCFVPYRPRLAVAPSSHAYKSRRTAVILCAESGDPDLAQDIPPAGLASPTGFALGDNPINAFATLSDSADEYARGGAYAIRNPAGQLCYMGYSKNIAAKLAFHERLVPEQCATFQVYVPPVPEELISPDMLESVLEYWVRENGGVPTGNTVDRALWEQETPVDRKKEPTANRTGDAMEGEREEDIPVRERTTPRRTSVRDRPADSYDDNFVDNFRSSSGSAPRRRRKDGRRGWDDPDDDYVEVDVDPLDPFSASNKRQSTRSAWDSQGEDDEYDEDWIPIIALMGCAGLIWLVSMLGNALPAATPSLGM